MSWILGNKLNMARDIYIYIKLNYTSLNFKDLIVFIQFSKFGFVLIQLFKF